MKRRRNVLGRVRTLEKKTRPKLSPFVLMCLLDDEKGQKALNPSEAEIFQTFQDEFFMEQEKTDGKEVEREILTRINQQLISLGRPPCKSLEL